MVASSKRATAGDPTLKQQGTPQCVGNGPKAENVLRVLRVFAGWGEIFLRGVAIFAAVPADFAKASAVAMTLWRTSRRAKEADAPLLQRFL
jgi:hypothetical protein